MKKHNKIIDRLLRGGPTLVAGSGGFPYRVAMLLLVMLDSLWRIPAILLVVVIDEFAKIFFTHGWVKLTGQALAFLCSVIVMIASPLIAAIMCAYFGCRFLVDEIDSLLKGDRND